MQQMSPPVHAKTVAVMSSSPAVRRIVTAACRQLNCRVLVLSDAELPAPSFIENTTAFFYHLNVLSPESWAHLHRISKGTATNNLFVLIDDGILVPTIETSVIHAGAAGIVQLPGSSAFEESVRVVARQIEQLVPDLRPGDTWRPSLPEALVERQIEVIAIGASTGGPNVLSTILSSIPSDFPIPILIVQHMPAGFTRLLAQRLNEITALPVKEADNNAAVVPGIWIAPGGYHLHVVRTGPQLRMRLGLSAPVHGCRPAVDVLFQDLAVACGPSVVVCVLTGVGKDGTEGCRAIRNAGGVVIAQDEETSVVWGMPGSVVRAGLAHRVLSPAEIGRLFLQLSDRRHGDSAPASYKEVP